MNMQLRELEHDIVGEIATTLGATPASTHYWLRKMHKAKQVADHYSNALAQCEIQTGLGGK